MLMAKRWKRRDTTVRFTRPLPRWAVEASANGGLNENDMNLLRHAFTDYDARLSEKAPDGQPGSAPDGFRALLHRRANARIRNRLYELSTAGA
jgi:hypothetical protein